MKNRILSFWLLLLIMAPAFGVAQKELSLDDAVIGRWGNLAPERLANLNWIPETDFYTYVEKLKEGQTLIMVNASTFKQSEVITTKELTAELALTKEISRIPNFTWLSKSEAYFIASRTVYMFNAKSKKVTKSYSLPKDGANFEFAPNSADVAFTRENNLFVIVDGKEYQVTKHTDPNIVAGQTVSRVEFGIEHGVIWSKSGKQLAFYEKDETQVTSYPLVDYTERPAKLNSIKYPMAGMNSEITKVGIYAVGKDPYYLNTEGEKNQYLPSVTWGPKEKFIYVGHLNRDQNDFYLRQYEVKSGEITSEILHEENEKYVHPTHPLYFINENDFLWMTEKNGLNQFVYYNVPGNVSVDIVTNDILVRSFVQYNEKTNKLYFMGNHKDKIDLHLFEITIDGGESENLKQLTKGDAYHGRALLNTNSTFAIVQSSSLNTANAYDMIELSNGAISNVFTSKNPLADYKIGKTKLETIKATDGETILHTRMILPYDFDESKKYPVLIYVYNGPGVQLLHSSWNASASLWMYHFANKGYIVYTLDGRGSTNRGIEFEQATFRNLGQVEMKDQIAGVEHLKSLPYVDGSRLAIHGWSYGGFMTTGLMTSYPDVFKVGAAGGPVMDWRYYEIMYTERFMDTPEDNPEGYDLTSNILRAKELKGKLLIIHGTVDPTVVKQNSDLFLTECIKNGVQVDYFEYPGHEHNVRGKDRVHLMQKILDYVEAYL